MNTAEQQTITPYSMEEIVTGLGLTLEDEPKQSDRPTSGAARETPGSLSDGQRRPVYSSLIGSMLRRKMSKPAIVDGLKRENREKGNPPWPDEKVEALVNSLWDRYAHKHNESTSYLNATNVSRSNPDATPQPETEEATAIINEWIADINSTPKDKADATASFTPPRIAAAARIQREMPTLYADLNKACKKHTWSKLLWTEINRYHVDSKPEKGEQQAVSVEKGLEIAERATPPSLSISPRDLFIPTPFGFDKEGIGMFGLDPNGQLKRTHVSHRIVIPHEISKDTDSGTETVSVVYESPLSNWQKTDVPRADLLDPNKIIGALGGKGGPANSQNKKTLPWYFGEFLEKNPKIPIRMERTQLGWGKKLDSFQFGKSRTLIPSGSPSTLLTGFRALDVGNEQQANAFRQQGSLEGYRKAIEPLRPYPVPQLVIGASLAASLLPVIGVSSFGFDLCCKTSRGKTLTSRVAARAWGNAEPGPDSLICPWDTTVVGIERRASMLNGIPIFIDDSRNANPKIVDAVVYGISNNMGRVRGSRRGSAASSGWNTILISTGESPLTSLSGQHKGGKNVRMISLDRLPYGHPTSETLKLVELLDFETEKHCGNAGPAFVQYLLDNQDKWPEWRDRHKAIAESYLLEISGEAYRVAKSCAAIALAIQLAQEATPHILPSDWTDPFTMLWGDIERSLLCEDPAVLALYDIYSWANINSASLYGQADYDKRKPWYGQWSDPFEHLNIFPKPCKEALESYGHDVEAILREWMDRGWLDCSKDRKYQRRIKCRCRQNWAISIKKSAFYEVGVLKTDVTGFEKPIESYDDSDEPASDNYHHNTSLVSVSIKRQSKKQHGPPIFRQHSKYDSISCRHLF